MTCLLLGVGGLAGFAQQFCVQVLVLGVFLSYGALQRGDLLLRSAQTLLKPLGQAAVLAALSLHRLEHSQQVLVAFTYKILAKGKRLFFLISLVAVLTNVIHSETDREKSQGPKLKECV